LRYLGREDFDITAINGRSSLPRFAARPGPTVRILFPPAGSHVRAIGTNRPRSILKWRLKRVGDDLDRRFQGLDPLLSITGVGILFRMAEQISFYIRFDGIFAIR
jgi:hypothetical protein